MTADVDGRVRVLINNVQPSVDGGRYPAKRTVGEKVEVTADIIADGHDHIRAVLLYRHESMQERPRVEMIHENNDRWKASFTASEKGLYVFTVNAWIDHLDTWYDGFRKKAAAGVDTAAEMLEGGELLRAATKEDASPRIAELVALMADVSKHAEVRAQVLSREFADIVHNHPLE